MRLDAMKMHISRLMENQRLGQNFRGEAVAPQLEKARDHLVRTYGLSEDYVRGIHVWYTDYINRDL